MYESNVSSTSIQIGLALKSIFAQFVNSVILPILVSIYVQNDMFQSDGLTVDIFYLAVTNAFLRPVLKLIDIGYIIRNIKLWFVNRPCRIIC